MALSKWRHSATFDLPYSVGEVDVSQWAVPPSYMENIIHLVEYKIIEGKWYCLKRGKEL